MSTVMDKETKKIMDEIEEKGFFKSSAKEEVKKFVDDGGMKRQVLVDGAYRDIDDIDGFKLQKEKRISAIFWIGLAAVLIAGAVIIGVMTVNGTLEL